MSNCTLSPRDRRQAIEAEMERDKTNFHRVSKALEKLGEAKVQAYLRFARSLRTIHDEQLYRADYSTWDSYCEQRWGISRRHGNHLLVYIDVVERVEGAGTTVPTERQARELARLPEEAQPAAWEAATADGASPTAARLRELRERATADVGPERLAQMSPEEQRETITRNETRLREEEAQQVGGEQRGERLEAVDRAIRKAIKLAEGLGDESDKGVKMLERARAWFAELPSYEKAA